MANLNIRKTVINVESIVHDGGPPRKEPLRVGVAAAVIANPYAGRYVEDITPFMDEMKPLGLRLATELLSALGGNRESVESFGKASIVGANGEIEHAALWHVPGGHGLREVLDAKSFVPAAKMVGSVGVRLMIPLLYVDTVWVRSHYGIAEISIHDAPKPDELVVAIAMSNGGRVHPRIGGLTVEQARQGQGPSF